jgi:DNA transformation protein
VARSEGFLRVRFASVSGAPENLQVASKDKGNAMPLSPGFSDHIEELLAGFGKVEVRRMFGGAGVYRGGVGFAILDDDTFFIKADSGFGTELKKRGSKPWSYSIKKDGTVRDIAYWSIPESAMDDPDEASALARRSHQIAVKADAIKAKKPKKSAARSAAKAAKKASARNPPAMKKTKAKKK